MMCETRRVAPRNEEEQSATTGPSEGRKHSRAHDTGPGTGRSRRGGAGAAVTHAEAGRPRPAHSHRGSGTKPPRAPPGAIVIALPCPTRPRLAGPWAVGSAWGPGQRSGFWRQSRMTSGPGGRARADWHTGSGPGESCEAGQSPLQVRWGRRGRLHRAGTWRGRGAAHHHGAPAGRHTSPATTPATSPATNTGHVAGHVVGATTLATPATAPATTLATPPMSLGHVTGHDAGHDTGPVCEAAPAPAPPPSPPRPRKRLWDPGEKPRAGNATWLGGVDGAAFAASRVQTDPRPRCRPCVRLRGLAGSGGTACCAEDRAPRRGRRQPHGPWGRTAKPGARSPTWLSSGSS